MAEQNNLEYAEALQKFKIYYDAEMLPELRNVEKIRKKYFYIFCILCIFVLFWLISSFQQINTRIFGNNEMDLSQYGWINCFIILVACMPMFCYYTKSKTSQLQKLVKFFGDFQYIYRPQISEEKLAQSLIFKKYDYLTTDDGFFGTYNNIAVEISEYALYEYRINREKRNKRHEKTEQGIIFDVQFNKKFSGQTIVVKDKGLFNKITHYKKMERVGLEDTVFEKAYEVYSNDQIEARYILTPVMIQYMNELKTEFKEIEFSFYNEHLLIKIKTKKNMFECANFFTSVINEKRTEKHFKELYTLFSVIDTLRLNQKVLL